MEIIKHLQQITEKITGSNINERLMRSSYLFVLSSITNIRRIKIQRKDTNIVKYMNFFGVSFAQQGYGKDTTLFVAEKMFEEAIEAYPQIALNEFNKINKPLPNGDDLDDKNYIIPSTYKIPIQGTLQGVMRVGNFYSFINKTALNIVSTEFGHEINQDILSGIVKLWQDGKHDGSTNVNEKYPPIKNVPTNILLFGSPEPFNRNSKRHDSLVEMIMSGLGRRSLFLWMDYEPKIKKEKRKVDFTDLQEFAEQIKVLLKDIDESQQGIIYISEDALEVLNNYVNEKFNEFNNEPNAFTNIGQNMSDLAERLSGLVAISNLNKTVTRNDMKTTISFIEDSLNDIKSIVEPPEKYRRIYKIASKKIDKYYSILDFEQQGITFRNAQEREYTLEMLEEVCFYYGKKLTVKGKRFKIEEPQKSNLNKIIVSLSVENDLPNPAMSVFYKSNLVPFFGQEPSIETLITHNTIKSFTTVHFNPKNKNGELGYRDEKYLINKSNMIAFDIDDKMSIEEAKIIFEPYTYIMYTTRNHQKEKGGIIADRFRILLPTKTIFEVNPEQHKMLYENIAEFLKLPIYDVATRNMGRLWFTNNEAIVYTNNKEPIDVMALMPDTNMVENVRNKYIQINIPDADDEKQKRIDGMIKWATLNGQVGDRNNTLSKLAFYLRDIGCNNLDDIVQKVNEMFSEPLSDKEVNTIIKHKKG